MYLKLSKMFYLSQLFSNSMFAFLLQELQYIYVTVSAKTVPIGTTIEIHFMA